MEVIKRFSSQMLNQVNLPLVQKVASCRLKNDFSPLVAVFTLSCFHSADFDTFYTKDFNYTLKVFNL